MSRSATASYLEPYHDAVRRHGAGFRALLWASPDTQAARFDAMSRLFSFRKLRILDAGCGRADLLDWLIARDDPPAEYIGLEGVPELAAIARGKPNHTATIIEADFVREPQRLLTGSDVIVFCGSLNTLAPAEFFATVTTAWQAAERAVVLNFLCSPRLAGASWLSWHAKEKVERFAVSLGARPVMLEDYMEGDCTVLMEKRGLRIEDGG